MSLSQFITAIKGSQAQFRRFSRIVEYTVVFYLLVAYVWTVCYLVGDIFTKLGVG